MGYGGSDNYQRECERREAREAAMQKRLRKYPKLIGLSGFAGSGKSAVSKILIERYGYQRMRFAEPLKAMLRTMGLSEREVDGDHKEVPSQLLGGKTPRWAMQTLGTEWGRTMIDSQLWVNAWERMYLNLHLSLHVPPVVVDDVRFENEVARIKDLGGLLIRVKRECGWDLGALQTHSSELIGDLYWDYQIQNHGSLVDLEVEVISLFERLAADV